MGVVNVTPDSFSDGGRYLALDAAVAHGRDLAAQGAAIVDVGGESTRPGSAPVDAAEEAHRVVPVVEALAASLDMIVSVDTMKASVAAAALDAGAIVVNDVTAGRNDGEMLGVVADHDAGFVAMHMQGEPATMQRAPSYQDVVAEVGAFLAERVGEARAAGVRADALLADPGIGFGKTTEHNLELLAALPALAARAGVPLLVGASRKSFLAKLCGVGEPETRDDATLATSVWAFENGARVVRVHDVAGSVRAARLLDVIQRATPEGNVA